MKIKIATSIIFTIFLFSGCAAKTERSVTRNDNLPGFTHVVNQAISEQRSISGTFDDAKALQILYGDYRPDLHGSMRMNVAMPDGTVEASAISSVLLSAPYEEKHKRQHVLVLQTSSEDYSCHACMPLVSAAIFQENDHAWQLLSSFASVPVSGADGRAAWCEWREIGKDNYGLVSKLGGLHQGRYYSQLAIVTLTGNTATQILSSDSESEHGPATSTLSFQKSKDKYWKASVGFEYPHSKKENKTLKYEYADGHYKEVAPTHSVR